MIDVRIEDRTIVEERGISGDSLELMTEILTLAAYVFDWLGVSKEGHAALKNILGDAIKQLEYGNIREGRQQE